MENRAALRHFAFTFLVAFLAIFVLLQSDVLSHVAYSIEKGRIKAIRETLPSEEELAQQARPAREVARVVSPSVVFIETMGPSIMDAHNLPLEEMLDEMRREGATEEELQKRREMFERYLDRLEPRSGVGSGFVVDADRGFLVTNYHVIDGAEAIEVQLPDGRRFVGEVVGADPPTDLAVVKIDADGLFEVEFGDSETAEVGDAVFALGNPFRLAGTVSRGIISGKGRHSVAIGGVVYQGFLQTDAVINPGNSGGPLVNMRGEVIGVNTAIATQTGHYDGVGFAIPASRVVEILPQLLRGESIQRGYLGILPLSVSEVQDEASERGWSEDYGVFVGEVLRDTPAMEAGLRPGDIITRLDGVKLVRHYQLIEAIGQMKPGDVASLEIWRDGDLHTLSVELALRHFN